MTTPVLEKPIPPVPSAQTLDSRGSTISQPWQQWFINLRDKVNQINGVVVAISGSNTTLGAFNTLSPLTTTGDMLTYGSGNNTRLPIGSTGQILAVVSGMPAWVDSSAGSTPLTTKGDLYGYNTAPARIPVGTDSYVLTADSTNVLGVSWRPAGTPTLPLTTKGDILGYDTAANRIPVGANGYILTADSTQVLGVGWKPAPSSSPLTTKGDLYGFDTGNARIPVGSDGQILTADSTQVVGVSWKSSTSWTVVKKSTNESRSSTTTPTNDGMLVVSLLTSTKYHIRGYLLFNQSDSSMGNKLFTNYTGTTSSVYYTMSEIVAGSISNSTTYAGNSNSQISTSGGGGGTGYVSYNFNIIISTTAAGVFSIQWSQQTSSANSLTLLGGSYFEYLSF